MIANGNTYCKIASFGPVLPAGYQQVEYIESTGTQYIDTNTILNDNDFEIKSYFSTQATLDGEQPLFSIWGGTYGYWNVFTKTQTRYVDAYLNAHNILPNFSLVIDEKTFFSFKRSGTNWLLIVDNNEKPISYTPSKTNINTLKIFARGDRAVGTYAKCYEFKLYINNILTLNLIPCYRKSDNEIGMYDTVNKVFYTNQGTGTFLKGNNVAHTIRYKIV